LYTLSNTISLRPGAGIQRKQIQEKTGGVARIRVRLWYLMKPRFFGKRNSKLCHTRIHAIIASKEMWVPAAQI
jgi:hypothetical protein